MSNLPPPAFQGVVEYTFAVDIDAPIELVWGTVVDLDSYPLWNPYLRSAVMVDSSSHEPTEDHTLREDTALQLAMQTPPGLDSTKKPTVVYEHVSLVDHATRRITWGGGRAPSVFRAEQAQALSTTADGKTRYETRHVFGGLSAYAVKCFMGTNMQQCMQEMANALKQRVEGQSSE